MPNFWSICLVVGIFISFINCLLLNEIHHQHSGNIYLFKEEKHPLPTAFIEAARQELVIQPNLLELNAQNFSLTYNQIAGILDNYADVRYRNFTQLYQLSVTTNETRPIIVFKVSASDIIPTKQESNIVISCGTHASEWVSVAACMGLIRQLVAQRPTKFDWIIIPVANPDGYEYSRTVDATWRKNRSPQYFTESGWQKKNTQDFGVDLNRNWPFRWVGDVASLKFLASPATRAEDLIGPMMHDLLLQAKASSPTYSGPLALSENETRALARYIFLMRHRIHAYITIHGINNGRYIMFPYSHAEMERIAEYDEFSGKLNALARRLSDEFQVNYTTGAAAKVLYPVHGSDIDWVYGIAAIPNTFVWELCNEKKRPAKKANIQTNVETFKVAERNAQEAIVGVRYLINML